jgi:GNAT superfamily N-acetyltransferase
MKIELETSAEEKAKICTNLLAALPTWFGDKETNLEYIEDVRTRMMFVTRGPAGITGFLSLTKMTDSAFDIHVLAVLPALHRQGTGRTLIDAAKDYTRDQGAAFLTVKTLGPSMKNADYAATRRFYRAVGFFPLEENFEIWGEGVPCLIMCQALPL